ncbi:hypothetical protein [Jeotgalibacillus marinus]|uniref:Uncharacterized protein n=1 Tax=Jeotgalibacillus marinus TaxID=86667 RepID=A0ABV3Q5G8_9BACL
MVGVLVFNGKTLMVPDEFPTISDAVTEANPADIILVKAKGNGDPYTEEVTISKENIKLIGIGKVTPVIDGGIIGSIGITIMDTSGVLVKNFIVQNFDDVGLHILY